MMAIMMQQAYHPGGFAGIEDIANDHTAIPLNQTMRRIPFHQPSVSATDESMTV
jgi:hypothetical protein